MRKIIVSEFVTLDGVMEGPGRDDPFELAGWTMPYANQEIGKFKFDELFASDALLLGRVTYEGFAKAWPTMKNTGEFGERMNSIPKYVVSTMVNKADWNNSTIIKKNAADEVLKLKQQSGGNILVAGSAALIGSLMEHNLVDEYRLLIYPVVLGKGKRLFRDDFKTKLKLIETKTFSSSVVALVYKPVQDKKNKYTDD